MYKTELTRVTGNISSAPSTSPTTNLTEQLRRTSWSTGLSMDLIYGIAAIQIIFFWSNCMASWTTWIDTVYKTLPTWKMTTFAHIYSITGYNANANWILNGHIKGADSSQVCFLQFCMKRPWYRIWSISAHKPLLCD